MDDLIRRSPVISIHAPPRGATTPTSTKPTSPPHFNSRPSARGDRQPNHADRRHQISIHAPPRGATPACGVRLEGWAISIHAPPRGATALPGNRRMPTCNFNSRPSARGDMNFARRVAEATISIHAPPRGATAYIAFQHPAVRFQFTPLREGRPS